MAGFLRTLMRSSLCARLLAVAAVFAVAGADLAAAQGQSSSYRIIRIVNDQPITSYDVNARLRLVSATAPTAISSEDAERFTQQIIDNLINEKLQLQEADRLNIEVQDSEIQAAVQRIENQNGLQAGQLIQFLTQRNVDANTFIDQIRATLAWRKAVSQRLRTRVTVTEEDIDFYLESLRQKGGTEYLLSEIFVAAHDPSELPRAKATTERLATQIRSGAPFTEMAQQFSQSPTAATGGDMGWIKLDQIERPLAEAVRNLRPGQISPPIGVADGYYLLALRQSRTFGADGEVQTVYDLRRVFLPFPAGAGENTKRQILIRLAQARPGLNNCAAVEQYATRAGDPQNGNMGEMTLNEIPQGLRQFVLDLQPGQISQLLRLQDGALVLMLCDKKTRALGLPDREAVRETLLQREADILARRYMRELRQNAIIQTVEEPV